MPQFLRGPQGMLLLMPFAMSLSLNGWLALLNNFAVERIAFTGVEIGLLHTIREIPGFMAFAAVLLLPFIKEQNLAILSLVALGVGTALTGYSSTAAALYFATFAMSVGFHYYETMNQSLTLQLISKDQAPLHLASQLKAASIAALSIYIVIIFCFDDKLLLLVQQWLGITQPIRGWSWGYEPLYLGAGVGTLAIALFCRWYYPVFQAAEVQSKKLFLRQRYWLFYALVFMSGARRQIFMVFAGFLMVDKFGYDVSTITLLYIINLLVNIVFAPYIGRIIRAVGERNALAVEYIALIGVFIGYGIVDNHLWAAALYVIDHIFFAFAIAIKTYFQKIADPKDIASSAGVSFTINHIAAVSIPVVFGYLYVADKSSVFYLGAAMAFISLILALMIPRHPQIGTETIRRSWR